MSSNPNIPQDGYLRIPQIIGDPLATPPILPIIPISKSGWWAGVKSGRYPAPVKLSEKVTVWRAEDIRALLNEGIQNDVSKTAPTCAGAGSK